MMIVEQDLTACLAALGPMWLALCGLEFCGVQAYSSRCDWRLVCLFLD